MKVYSLTALSKDIVWAREEEQHISLWQIAYQKGASLWEQYERKFNGMFSGFIKKHFKTFYQKQFYQNF